MKQALPFLLAAGLVAGMARPASAQLLYGLESPADFGASGLVSFDVSNPSQFLSYGFLTGLGSFRITSIEVHPQTDQLYGLGINRSTPDNISLFLINPTTLVATPVGAPLTVPLGMQQRPGKCCLAFDPADGSARVTTAAGYNYRLDATTGALLGTDTPLQYAATDANAGQPARVQGLTFAPHPQGGPSSRLFGLDELNSRLVQVYPLASGALQTVGPLGVSLNGTFRSDVCAVLGPTVGASTLYMLRTEELYNGYFYGESHLYAIDPLTGQAIYAGAICVGGNGCRLYLQDIAAPSAIISATRDRRELVSGVALAPNPAAHGVTTLTFTLPRAQAAELRVFDSQGRQVASQRAAFAPGRNSWRWDCAGAGAGLYLVQLVLDGQTAATRRALVE